MQVVSTSTPRNSAKMPRLDKIVPTKTHLFVAAREAMEDFTNKEVHLLGIEKPTEAEYKVLAGLYYAKNYTPYPVKSGKWLETHPMLLRTLAGKSWIDIDGYRLLSASITSFGERYWEVCFYNRLYYKLRRKEAYKRRQQHPLVEEFAADMRKRFKRSFAR